MKGKQRHIKMIETNWCITSSRNWHVADGWKDAGRFHKEGAIKWMGKSTTELIQVTTAKETPLPQAHRVEINSSNSE